MRIHNRLNRSGSNKKEERRGEREKQNKNKKNKTRCPLCDWHCLAGEPACMNILFSQRHWRKTRFCMYRCIEGKARTPVNNTQRQRIEGRQRSHVDSHYLQLLRAPSSQPRTQRHLHRSHHWKCRAYNAVVSLHDNVSNMIDAETAYVKSLYPLSMLLCCTFFYSYCADTIMWSLLFVVCCRMPDVR